MTQKEINLLTEIDRPEVSCKKRLQIFMQIFMTCVYLSIGPEAKRDIYNTFDPDKTFNIHLEPPSTERPPLVEIKQEGKTSIYTTDFYFTNKLPSNITVQSPSENNTMPTGDQAAAADPTLFDTDPLQPGKIHLTLLDVIYITSTHFGFNRRKHEVQGRHLSCISRSQFMPTRRQRREV